ncbi:MAG: hypothetical protein NZ518_12025 [Dehalococcoidia bacterium]|nr:hypothetical protein [Dehalococcoidia bacterium]
MRTEIYEADPFSGARGKTLATIDTDYRFEKNDEVFLETGGASIKLRITAVRVRIKGDTITRELVGLKL